MRRLLYAAAFVAAAMLAFAGTAGAATIFAGQTTAVGTATAAQNGVTIDLDTGWCMTESQVAVGTIPVNKSGNPAPGQFSSKNVYGACVTSGFHAITIADGQTVAVQVKLYQMTESTVSAVSHPGETV